MRTLRRRRRLRATMALNAGQPGAVMLILGRVGITFGVALAGSSLRPESRANSALHVRAPRRRLHSAIASLARRVDLRLLLLASLLPDIIDKPVGYVLFPDVFGTGRLLSHALVFPIALAVTGMWLYRSRRSSLLLVLASGAGMHLVLDAMWRTPSILLWPFAGPLPRGLGVEGWLAGMLAALLTNPAVFAPDIAGGILLVPLLRAILGGAGLKLFLRSGVVG